MLLVALIHSAALSFVLRTPCSTPCSTPARVAARAMVAEPGAMKLKEIKTELDELGVRYEVLGGGRIKHDSAAKKIEIYGFSYGFPWADEPRHDLSAEAVRAAFPDFEVTTSNAGY